MELSTFSSTVEVPRKRFTEIPAVLLGKRECSEGNEEDNGGDAEGAVVRVECAVGRGNGGILSLPEVGDADEGTVGRLVWA